MHKIYEMVIGLEVHVELKTASKIFCGCQTTFGQAPNTQVCPVCLGLPGSLPVLNEKVVDFAVKAGLATNCSIARHSKQDRKNYFYPDLAKAYQISQYDEPLCEKGHIDIWDTTHKRIGITRIHIEEDAGKLVHHPEEGTLIDYNRAGVPLIEIVSEPDMRSAQEAKLYLQKLRGILLYTDVSDCKMNEGSFRCDVNLSVRKKGETTFGTRTEMKNLNSFSSITKAIEHEFQRQVKVLETGGTIVQETRKWDQDKGKSISMRTKEDAHDYRYFPDPDLQPIVLDDDYIQSIKDGMPELPEVKKKRYHEDHGLSEVLAEQLSMDKYIAEFYEEALAAYDAPLVTANLMIGELTRIMEQKELDELPFTGKAFSSLVRAIDDGQINMSIAKKVLLIMFEEALTAEAIIERDQLALIKSQDVLLPIVKEVIAQSEKVVADYRSGKDKALQSLIGQVMKHTKGQADPEICIELFRKLLD